MSGGFCLNVKLLQAFILFLFLHESHCHILDTFAGSMRHRQRLQYRTGFILMEEKDNALLPMIPPTGSPQPFIPLLAPSPLAPFANSSIPRLSGRCTLNFSAAESMITTTAVDCWSMFAPFLANVICCPQLHATLVILVGQSSKATGMLALDASHAKNCLSDVQQILMGQGANENLQQICSIRPSNLTESSCPVKDVNGFESVVDSSKLLLACEKVDPVNECCSQICQNAIFEAARKIALKDGGLSGMNDAHIFSEYSSVIDDCKSVVHRWLASRLDPDSATQVLRRISNCNVNKACPLAFPDTRNVSMYCGNVASNRTACCNSMDSYKSHLQKQSFITNLQALDCAARLGVQLKKVNISKNIYSLCHITLKDFSVQVGSQESGCLLPSLPTDATFDHSSGFGFTCDLNDNIAAPWPSTSQVPASSCNKKIKLPALPAATSSWSDPRRDDMVLPLFFFSLLVITMLL